MNEFLNPKSMLTPGVAGATMMFLVNGLAQPFPELPERYVALALSFAIGTVAFSAKSIGLVQRGIFWVLNSLVIFVVGFGTANLGHEAVTRSAASGMSVFAVLVPVVHAADELQPPKAPKQPSAAAAKPAHVPQAAELEALRRENERLKAAAKEGVKPDSQGTFFRKW